jgi:hypothetical protein
MTDTNLKNSRKKDKAAALLALIADGGEGHGACLSPGEMAALVDNTCAKEERVLFMDHLSCCETCYGEWLTLKKMDDPQACHGRKGGRLYRFSKRQQYGFIGSAIALAASVAVYLNISPLPDTFLDSSSEKPALVQPDSRLAAPTLTMEKVEKKSQVESENAVPRALKMTDALPTETTESMEGIEDKEIHGRSALPPDVGVKEQQEMLETAAPSPKALQALPALPLAGKKIARQKPAGAGGMPVDVDSWLAQVEEHCRAGNQDVQFWAEMQLQGKTMLAQQAGLLPRERAEKVSAALLLLGEMGPAAVTEQCRLLLDLLAEDEKNRRQEPSP